MTNETGLKSTSGKNCLYTDEFHYQSDLAYLLIKRKTASCSWVPEADKPPSVELLNERLPSNVKCYVNSTSGSEPTLEICSLPSCTSLAYCDPEETLKLGRPTYQEAVDNLYKSSDAGALASSLKWVDDLNFPHPQKVQVSVAT